MKNLKLYIVLISLLVINSVHIAFAQSASVNIPGNITTAFTSKYPTAEIKGWEITPEGYTAKAKQAHHKFYATFSKNGNWIATKSKVNWPWGLSPAIKKAFRKSTYGSWHIYAVNKVETPAGQIYQLLADNTNYPADAFHQNVQTDKRVLEFKANGEFVEDHHIEESASR